VHQWSHIDHKAFGADTVVVPKIATRPSLPVSRLIRRKNWAAEFKEMFAATRKPSFARKPCGGPPDHDVAALSPPLLKTFHVREMGAFPIPRLLKLPPVELMLNRPEGGAGSNGGIRWKNLPFPALLVIFAALAYPRKQ